MAIYFHRNTIATSENLVRLQGEFTPVKNNEGTKMKNMKVGTYREEKKKNKTKIAKKNDEERKSAKFLLTIIFCCALIIKLAAGPEMSRWSRDKAENQSK